MHPFRAVGYSVHERDGPSASSTHPARFGDAVHAVEYAIWWDWDIQISCEMERVWVCLSGNDQPMRGESSTRSCEGEMRRKRQRLPLKSGRITHFSEPGKHAFAANPERRCTNDTAASRRCGNWRRSERGVHPRTARWDAERTGNLRPASPAQPTEEPKRRS